jgi:hypothetical protein
MYQDHQHTITRYVSQPCTKPYQASTMYHNLYHNKCINHAPTPIPNCASTMHLNLYHMPQPSTMYTKYQSCIIPCINHVHQHHTKYQSCTITMCQPYTSTMYINTCTIPYQQCISTIYHITLNHAMYHKISLKYIPISQICASNNEP